MEEFILTFLDIHNFGFCVVLECFVRAVTFDVLILE